MDGTEMTTAFVPVAGEAESRSSDHAQCGSLACESALAIVGAGTMHVLNNSNAQKLAAGIGSRPGVLTRIVSGNLADIAPTIKDGEYLIGLVHCTGNAVPTDAA